MKEINNRINLQEKILNAYKKNERKGNYLANKIKKITKKEKKDLLMNQVDNYRNKIEKININSQRKKNYENYNRRIQWLSSLRRYDNNNKNISEKKEDNNNELYSTYNSDNNNINNNFYNTNFYKTISSNKSNKEEILDNYINKISYSFGNTNSLYSDIESNITPLYALILPQNSKNKETIKNNRFYENNSLPIIIGKNLLDYEIGISK